MRVGSLAWLLRHELRLAWRDPTANIAAGWLALLAVALLAGLHMALWGLLRGLKLDLSGAPPFEVVAIVGLVLAALFPLALTFGINRSVTVFYERGDMDLLASSPLGARVIFASRVLSVAGALFVTALVLAVPLAGAGLLTGAPRLLGAYPLALATALTAASLGMLVTLGLVRLLGARRARTASQVLAAVAGGALFLAAQVPNLMRDQASSALQRWVLQLQPLFAEGGALGPGSVVWLPARALFLDPLALAVTLCGAAALAWLTAATLHGTFMSGGRQAVTAPTRRRADAGGVRFRPRSVTRLVLLKEWRLILRDPYLLSQVLLQLVYMVPLLVVLPRGPGSVGSLDLTAGLAGMLVMLAGTLVMGLTLIVVGGEEAHDLLAAAPVPRARLERLKLAAALAPVWALALVPLALLAWQRPALGMLTAVALGLATLSSALLRLWNPAPAKRADLFKRRGRRGDPVMNFVEGLLPLLWGGWVAFVGSGAAWAWWLPPVALALTGAGYLYGPRRAAAARLLTRGERATT